MFIKSEKNLDLRDFIGVVYVTTRLFESFSQRASWKP